MAFVKKILIADSCGVGLTEEIPTGGRGDICWSVMLKRFGLSGRFSLIGRNLG